MLSCWCLCVVWMTVHMGELNLRSKNLRVLKVGQSQTCFGQKWTITGYDNVCKIIGKEMLKETHYMAVIWWKYKGQECIPVGCIPAAHWPYAGGSPQWGVSLPGRHPCQGGFSLPEGLSLQGVGWFSLLGESPCQGGLLARGPTCQSRGLRARGFSLLGGFLDRGISLPVGRGPPCQGVLPARGFSLSGGSPCQGVLPAGGFSLPETPPVDRIKTRGVKGWAKPDLFWTKMNYYWVWQCV